MKTCEACGKESDVLFNTWIDGRNQQICRGCLKKNFKGSTVKKGQVEFDGQKFVFADGVYKEMKRVFADKDVDGELTKAARWLARPGQKAYRDFVKFLWNWMNRAPMRMRPALNEVPGLNRPTEKPYNPNGPAPNQPRQIDFKSEIDRYKPT